MNRRIAIAKHWLLKNKNQVKFSELLSKIFEKTCEYKAKPFITELKEEGNYWKVKLKNYDNLLYFPQSISLKSLYQVITESTDKSQWHYYEIPETQVGINDIVADCGAAEGIFSLMIYNRCAKVYAIEPLPTFVKALNLTFSDNKKVEILPCALSDKTGVAYMDDTNITSALSNKGNVEVKLESLDNLFYHKGIRINYLKADLEGYEMDMLKGGIETIRQSRPKVAITTYHRAYHAREIADFLRNIHPDYNIKLKGIEERVGAPVMLHAW